MADADPTYGGRLMVGIGIQSDKITQAGGLTWMYCKPKGTLPKSTLGYKREKFAGGGYQAPSFKNPGEGNTTTKITTAWSPGLTDTLMAAGGMSGGGIALPPYVTMQFILDGSGTWTVVGARCKQGKISAKKSQGFFQLEIDFDAVNPFSHAAGGTAPAVSSVFAPLFWSDFGGVDLLGGDAGVKRIGSVDVEWMHNLQTYPGNNGNAFPSDLIPTAPDAKLTFEGLFVNFTAAQQFLTVARNAGTIALPIGAHTITMSNMEYLDLEQDADDVDKPSTEKITAESIPGSPIDTMLAIG